MITVFHPTGVVKGMVKLPSSKSISNRALIIREVSGYDFSISDLSDSSDTQTLLNSISLQNEELNCNDGGTTFRFLLALKALRGESCILTGSERMQQRPVKPLVDALNDLGADIRYLMKEGFPPLKINPSTLNGKEITIDASISSQFVSALMMIAPRLPGGLIIHLRGAIVSFAYILLTKKLMEYFGLEVILSANNIYISPSRYVKRDIVIEKDWSAASYWFEIAALANEADLLLEGLHLNSMQGDEIIVAIMEKFGVVTKQEPAGLRITKSNNITLPETFNHNFINHPDLVQTMAFLCAAKGVNGWFEGVQTLKIKETDRVEALKTILNKIGCDLVSEGNSFSIICRKPSKVNSDSMPVFNDHRMAMSISPLSLVYGKLSIEDHEVVNKSYPGFWNHLSNIGFEIH